MLLEHRDRNLLAAIHSYQRHQLNTTLHAKIQCNWAKLRYIFWSILSGSDIHRDANIAPTVRFPHLTGVVIHRDAKVGNHCMIMQQVTIGQTAQAGAPIIEAGVYVGAGAKILGNIKIGENARIGANAVVLVDVPPNATAIGVPARVIVRKSQ